MGEQPTREHILEIGLGFWPSKTLLSAAEMGLFTELARRPESLEAAQNRMGLHPRSLPGATCRSSMVVGIE